MWSYYSLIYRARHRFQKARVAPDWDFDDGYRVLQKELPFAIWLIERWRRRSSPDNHHAARIGESKPNRLKN